MIEIIEKILEESNLKYYIDMGGELSIYKTEYDKIETIYEGSITSFLEEVMKHFNIKKDY
jgi:hypothetical protein